MNILSNKIVRGIGLILMLVVVNGCTSASQVQKVIEENPEILFNAIEKNPKKFMDVVQVAARAAQKKAYEEQEETEKAKVEEDFKNPKKPKTDGRIVFGKKTAPIEIVEYSDFQCPACRQGANSVKEVRKIYGDKIKFIYKHFPLGKFPHSQKAALYYEAVGIQSFDKAEKFHDLVFEKHQALYAKGEGHLKALAKKLGVNMGKLAKDIGSAEILAKIEADVLEARDYGFSGTPAFVINGVRMGGARGPKAFQELIDRHLKK